MLLRRVYIGPRSFKLVALLTMSHWEVSEPMLHHAAFGRNGLRTKHFLLTQMKPYRKCAIEVDAMNCKHEFERINTPPLMRPKKRLLQVAFPLSH
jgi:hypothetical protein